jgi:hypothetical protein
MSAIADFRLIEISKLDELLEKSEVKIEKKLFSKKIDDNYWSYLSSLSPELIDFKWSGYIFANLLIFLNEKKGINLLQSEFDLTANSISERRQNSTMIFTSRHQKEYFDKLDLNNFTREELKQFNEEFSEEADDELVDAEISGIESLKKVLGFLDDDRHIILLNVG